MNSSISSFVALSPLILGQFPAASESEIGRWLLVAAAVAVIANQGITFWKNISGGLKEMPPPADTYVQKTVCKIIHTNTTQHLKEYREENQELRKKMSEDVKGIHERVDSILDAVGQLKGKVQ